MTRLALVLAVVLIAGACGSGEEDARRALEQRGLTVDPDEFLRRIRAGDLEAVELFLTAGMHPDARDAKGLAALVAIAGNGGNEHQLEITQRLLDAGADANIDEGLALVRAGWADNIGVLKALLDAGADVNAAEPRKGTTSLMMAADNGLVDPAKLLIDEGADVDAREKDGGWTALMFAADEGAVEVVKLLLDAGADVSVMTDNGRSAYRLASWQTHRDPVPVGLEDNKVSFRYVYAEIIQLLDDAGAEH